MIMRWLLALIAFPALAQWDSIDIRFEGVGCASCIESLPERLRRLRGVESVELDSEAGRIRLKLAAQNRVRIEQIRDFIEQDGTKAREAKVEGRGTVSRADGAWLFRPEGQSTNYRLLWKTAAQPPQPNSVTRIKGRMARLRGEPVEIEID